MSKKPECFNRFDKNSQFCLKVCKFAEECGGLKRTEEEVISHAFGTGVITFKEMIAERVRILVSRERLKGQSSIK